MTTPEQGGITPEKLALSEDVGQQTVLDLRKELFAHLHELAMRFFDRNPVGRLVTRLTNDVEVLNDLFSSGIIMIVGEPARSLRCCCRRR